MGTYAGWYAVRDEAFYKERDRTAAHGRAGDLDGRAVLFFQAGVSREAPRFL